MALAKQRMLSHLGLSEPDSWLWLKIGAAATATPLAFYDAYPTQSSRSEAWQAVGGSVPLDDFAKSTLPRPVYIIRGRGGRPALLLGPAGVQDVLPMDAVWFRQLGHKGYTTPNVAALFGPRVSGVPGTEAMSSSRFTWLSAGTKGEFTDSPMITPDKVAALILPDWKEAALLQGYFFIARSWDAGYRHITAPYWCCRANGEFPVAFINYNAAIHYGVSSRTPDKGVDAPPGNIPSMWTGHVGSHWNHAGGADTARWTVNPAGTNAFVTASLEVLAAEKPKWDAVLPTVAAKTVSWGSTFPWGFASTLIGFVVGVPGNEGAIMLEFDQLTAVSSGAVGRVTYGLWDITGADYKKMYPIGSLPNDAQASWSEKMAQLPNGFRFRVALDPTGLGYPVRSYDETIMARDVVRSGSSLTELLFDDLEDGKPPRSYSDLGAASLVAIQKGKNKTYAIPLDGSAGDFVSTAPLTFSRVEGLVVCTQATFQIDSGEALVAIRAGAAFTAAGVTLDEVAQEFFSLPDWPSVLTMVEDQAESRSYLIDEHQNSGDLRWNLDADEHARCVPLLLGFNTYDFAAGIAPLMLGVTSVEIPA